MRIYFDNCCFNRPFDDQSQLRIKLESEAKLRIQEEIQLDRLQLAWSYILDLENNINPYDERKKQIDKWKIYAKADVQESSKIIGKSRLLISKGLRKLDALHIACAIESKCDYFLTTDDKILNKVGLITEIKIIDPFGFIKEAKI